ncbi:hypothetical protein C1I97_02015 [Streptomyces sp. NTH33]|uniref:hypothetical protein n=1 Tax=Streptomyces sp. NTH33 TaxID=1735453 RepID=UPI000DA8FD2E|nr:hypothetical protein [Streptomyces sp. NTH33]PZH19757.1 hypothetical protein C1I97_02015 [Streptomyces sp. NTH33]
MKRNHQPQRPPAGPRTRQPGRHRRLWAAGIALLAVGAVGCGASKAAEPQPTVTVTATTTATATATATETVTAEPTATVTTTRTVKTPGPTVTVTRTALAAAGTGRSGGSGSGTRSGTCSIVSNSGNCYQAGQFCRNSDHGARTTTASGAPITCAYRSNAWRWTYS